MPPRRHDQGVRRLIDRGLWRSGREPAPTPGDAATPDTRIRQRLAQSGKRFYCVCFSARSGSTLLCEDMTQRGLGAPTEHFQFPEAPVLDRPLSDHLVELVEQWPGDYFGLKVAWQQAYELTSRLRQDDDPDVSLDLRTVFPDLAYLHIVRRDKIAQAVSSWRAVSSGTWHWPVGAKVDRGHPGYDFETIKAHLLQMIAEDWLWKSHFEEHAISPLVVTYEDYLEDRDGHLQRIADFLGGPRSNQKLEERIQVMRDEWTEQIAELVKADLEAPHQPYWVLPPGAPG